MTDDELAILIKDAIRRANLPAIADAPQAAARLLSLFLERATGPDMLAAAVAELRRIDAKTPDDMMLPSELVAMTFPNGRIAVRRVLEADLEIAASCRYDCNRRRPLPDRFNFARLASRGWMQLSGEARVRFMTLFRAAYPSCAEAAAAAAKNAAVRLAAMPEAALAELAAELRTSAAPAPRNDLHEAEGFAPEGDFTDDCVSGPGWR